MRKLIFCNDELLQKIIKKFNKLVSQIMKEKSKQSVDPTKSWMFLPTNYYRKLLSETLKSYSYKFKKCLKIQTRKITAEIEYFNYDLLQKFTIRKFKKLMLKI
jgi:hypothetical protein